ncbi:uncharacterized protein LOC121053255 [Oryza brachyantha]|uniref:uncharacterized protein LOC121053255 n=1 Tax=Oryza brachyantha TaxID=4533 RepID=UPI001ADB8092|nr:uncharacterized protein LOC121053255 [Oryza brachyantha]
MDLGLCYSGYPAVLEGYSDSDWISDADEIKATSGYVFTLGGGAISWRSCKQTILTRSTMEAELTALDTATVEAEWLRDLLMDLPIVEKPVPAILMNCDNQTVIVKVNSSKDNMKSSRHVKRRLKSVRKLRNSRVIMLDYIQTARNLADPFTKGLSRNVIDTASKEMDCHELEYLPEDFGNICKLAVLDLSGCYKIKVLLETFCQLMGLKDLNLSDCHGLQQLHESFGDLSEIQSLNLTNSISKMTSLIELNIATGQQRVLDKVQSIREHLNLPRAIKHDVHEMENVGSSSIVELGRLHCHELIVHWEHGGIRNVDKDKLVPENLVPPRTLESFGLYGYMCKDFPTWVSGISSYLPYLMCLRLANLAKCDHLPAFGQLPNLRNFCMEDIPSVRKIGREFYGDEGNCKKLKVIRLERMDNLEEWWTTRSGEEDKEFLIRSGEEDKEFLIPNLHLLQVTDYPKLSFLPWGRLEHLATLEIFYAKGCSGSRTLLDIIKCFLSLRVLHLISQEDMEILPEWLGQLVSLDEINIDNCRNLTSLPKSIQNLPALRELWLRERKGLEILPEGLGQLASLKKLLIMDCPKLTFLPESMMNLTGLEELWLGGFNSLPEWIGQLSCLKEINIFDSPNMTCLLESMQNLNNLKKLYIWNCPRLIERCREEDANKISHIPRVILDGKRVIPGQAIEGPEESVDMAALTLDSLYTKLKTHEMNILSRKVESKSNALGSAASSFDNGSSSLALNAFSAFNVMSDDQLEQLEEEDLAALINMLSRAMNNIRFKKRVGPVRCFACGGLDHIRSHCPKLGRAKKDDNGDKFKDDKPRSSFRGMRSKKSLKKMLDQVCAAFEPLSDGDGDNEEDENKGRHISGVCLMSRDESDSEGENNKHKMLLKCHTFAEGIRVRRILAQDRS